MFRFLDERTLASVASMQTTEHSPHSKYSITRELERMLPAANDDDSCFVAVCGGNKAGKRTFFKQLEIVGKGRFQTEADRQQFATVVQRFVIDNMRRVVAALCNGFLVQYDNLSHLWDSDLQKRLLFFAYARTTFQKIAACYGSAFPQKIRDVSGLDNWAPEYLLQCKKFLNVGYCPSEEDILRVVPLRDGDFGNVYWCNALTAEAGDHSTLGPNDSKTANYLFKFFNYDKLHETVPYKNYKTTRHRIVYIIDCGLPLAEMRQQLDEIKQIVRKHTCPIDVFFNKTEQIQTLDRKEVYTTFGLQAVTSDNVSLSILISRVFLKAARSGGCVVRGTYADLVSPGCKYSMRFMLKYWTNPTKYDKFYQLPRNV